ncbi:MAG: hypothetical protein ACI4I9_01275 [Porcipelethomonas sp.]
MGEQFWWIYDILSAAIIIFCIYMSAKKGFSKIIVSVIGCVVSVVLALAISRHTAGFVYEKFIKETSINAVREAMDEYDPSGAVKEIIEDQGYGALVDESRIKDVIISGDGIGGLYNYANNAAGDTVDDYDSFSELMTSGFAGKFGDQIGIKLPPYVTGEINDRISSDPELFEETLSLILTDPDKMPGFVEENFIREPGEKLSQVFMFLIFFFIFMAIIGFVSVKTSSFGLLNGYDRLDKFFGGVLGIIKAAAAMLVFAVVVKIMIDVAENDGSFLSCETVDKTFIFRHFFSKV